MHAPCTCARVALPVQMYVWDIDAYDKYGRWGPPPPPAPHPSSLLQLMGMNGIWGCGFNQYSSTLHA